MQMGLEYLISQGILLVRIRGAVLGSEIFRSLRNRIEATPYSAGIPAILDIRHWTGTVTDEEWRGFREWLLRFAAHHDLRDPTPNLVFLGRKGENLDAIAMRAQAIRKTGGVARAISVDGAWAHAAPATPISREARSFLDAC